MEHNFLQLNSAKTEAIMTGTPHQTQSTSITSTTFPGHNIPLSSSVSSLGVRLDYYNALFIGIPGKSLQRLQYIQTSAARILMRVCKYEHITPSLCSLRWLPISARIEYKHVLRLICSASLTPSLQLETLADAKGPCWIQQEMGSAQSRSNTHVANATDQHLRIYYQTAKMMLEDLVVKAEAGEGYSSSSFSAQEKFSSTMAFKPDSQVHYIPLPPKQYINIAGEGELFVSVLVEDRKTKNTCPKCICLNFHVPCDRSFIVTANENIKFQKRRQAVIDLTSLSVSQPLNWGNNNRMGQDVLSIGWVTVVTLFGEHKASALVLASLVFDSTCSASLTPSLQLETLGGAKVLVGYSGKWGAQNQDQAHMWPMQQISP
ncbi:hypothetical protein AOLI_G00252360 [Acnodon oligacanthus]